MKKVLVTGGCGFIGSHIVDELLENQYEVAVFDNLTTGIPENIKDKNVTFYYGDIVGEDLERVVASFKPDSIVHEAAQVSVQYSVSDCYYDANVNIQGTINIINACRKHQIKKVVFASSAAVYGNITSLPVHVTNVLQPTSPYGLSKYAAEEYLKLAKQLYDIDYVILRYSNVYGPRQNAHGEGGVISIFFNRILENEQPIIFGDGEQTRDFIFVKDVSRANVKALEYDSCGIFNISTASSVSVNDLLDGIKKQCSSTVSPLYQAARNGDIKDSILCNEESILHLNWEPIYSFNEGLYLTFQYYNRMRASLSLKNS